MDRRVALVGGESVLGQEIRDVASRRLKGVRMKLVGSQGRGTAILTEDAGEPVVLTSLDEETLAEALAVVLAGSAESSSRAMALLEKGGAAAPVIDCTHVLEDRPDARLRAPRAEPVRLVGSRIQVVAHPAAAVLASLLRALHRVNRIERAVVNLFEPASERGRGGIEELQQQTIELLRFQTPPQAIFGEQLSFNLLARYGDGVPVTLESVERRIDRHVASLLALDPPLPMPSVRLVQAPVMHGYSLSAWVEFAGAVEVARFMAAQDGIDWRGGEHAAPNVVGVAGEPGMAVSVERDRNRARAAWFWAASDNFRVTADHAVDLVEAVL